MSYTNYNKTLDELRKERWLKIFLLDFSEAFALISKSRQFDIIVQVLLHIDRHNLFTISMTEIAAKSGASYKSVQNTFNAMLEADMMRASGGTFMINPNLALYGKPESKEFLLKDYKALSRGKSGRARKMNDVE
jgi:predicted transcriptional regulator